MSKIDESKINGIIQMLEAGMNHKTISEITDISTATVSRVSQVLNAISDCKWDAIARYMQDGIMGSIAYRVMRIKNVALPQEVQEPAKESPASPAPEAANIDFLRSYTEQMLQYMTAINKKLSELDANLQKVMVDCQRQSNANTDVLMTELSKLTTLTEAIKCNTRRPK